MFKHQKQNLKEAQARRTLKQNSTASTRINQIYRLCYTRNNLEYTVIGFTLFEYQEPLIIVLEKQLESLLTCEDLDL